MIQYAQRSQELVLLQKPEKFERYAAIDSYLAEIKPQSVLVLPVRYQNELTCLFYLENRAVSCAFTQEQIKTLEVLASQAAISLENAQLYYQATHDNLTGLANRNLLYHVFKRSQAKAKHDHSLLAILYLDLDSLNKSMIP